MTSASGLRVGKTSRRRLLVYLGILIFTLAAAALLFVLWPPSLQIVRRDIAPVVRYQNESGVLLDLGKTWFGNVSLKPNQANTGNKIVIRLGERLTADGRIDRTPPGSVRFLEIAATLGAGDFVPTLTPKDSRGLPRGHAAMPFRYIEIEGWKGPFSADAVKASAYVSRYYNEHGRIEFLGDDERARDLNRLVAFGLHTVAATSFMGLFIDGDRERLPYQADAYINQLGWYAATGDTEVARRTVAQLLREPTWPSEWMTHFIFLAHEDYMMTGDAAYLRSIYGRLKDFTLIEFIDSTGLVTTRNKPLAERFVAKTRADYLEDIVDWPQNERDGYEMVPYNTVVNAFVYAGFRKMAELASALDNSAEEKSFTTAADRLRDAMESQLVDPERKVFADGLTSRHVSAHALFFPLAFNLVPEGRKEATLRELKSRIAAFGGGFPCSVYGAQYLLEALFENGEDAAAIDLMLNKTKRGWFNMIDAHGATVTHEAWDPEYKDNEDWNHAWGSAFLNVIQRKLVGLRINKAGWTSWTILPSTALGISIKATLPAKDGDITVDIDAAKRDIRIGGGRLVNGFQRPDVTGGWSYATWKASN